jgi:tRNA (guanine-N7-)-methyltransferase
MPNKLAKFADFHSFPHCFTYVFENLSEDFHLKGHWHKEYFKNENPIVLEIGCGYGEYTMGLGQKYPEKNFVGIDIKSNRMWTGARQALQLRCSNIAFIRTRVDYLDKCFSEKEVSEIWITFPDPQPQKPREKKRLTSPRFLELYKKVLRPDGLVHLKTDSTLLFDYSTRLFQSLGIKILVQTSDLYNFQPQDLFLLKLVDEARSIQTRYEKMFSGKGEKIKYLVFKF